MLLHRTFELQQKEKPNAEEKQNEEKEQIVELRGQASNGQHSKEAEASKLEIVFGLIEMKKLDCLDHNEELGKGKEKRGLKDEKQEEGVTKRED
jgi:ribosomal protein L29